MKYTRNEAIRRIREYILTHTREDENSCQAAARLGFFCHGYDQWSLEKLREMYPWLAAKLPPDAPREALMRLIVAWHGARQEVFHVETVCDANMLDHDGCLGFDRFTNPQLKSMMPELFAAEDEIEP